MSDQEKKTCCPTSGPHGDEANQPLDMSGVELYSVITCPECGHKEREKMPTDACQFFYYCKGCGARLRPVGEDCCVYCSYGSVPCPPIQLGGGK